MSVRKPSRLALAAVAASVLPLSQAASAYETWVDLNTYAKGREGGNDATNGAVARTRALAGADGVWLITANSGGDNNDAAAGTTGISTDPNAGFTLGDWRQIVANIAGPSAPHRHRGQPAAALRPRGPKLPRRPHHHRHRRGDQLLARQLPAIQRNRHRPGRRDRPERRPDRQLRRQVRRPRHRPDPLLPERRHQRQLEGRNRPRARQPEGQRRGDGDHRHRRPEGRRFREGRRRRRQDRLHLPRHAERGNRNVPGVYLLKQQARAAMAGGNVRFVLNNDYDRDGAADGSTDGFRFYGATGSVEASLRQVGALELAVPVETWKWQSQSGNWSTRSNWTVGPVASPLTASRRGRHQPVAGLRRGQLHQRHARRRRDGQRRHRRRPQRRGLLRRGGRVTRSTGRKR